MQQDNWNFRCWFLNSSFSLHCVMHLHKKETPSSHAPNTGDGLLLFFKPKSKIVVPIRDVYYNDVDRTTILKIDSDVKSLF